MQDRVVVVLGRRVHSENEQDTRAIVLDREAAKVVKEARRGVVGKKGQSDQSTSHRWPRPLPTTRMDRGGKHAALDDPPAA
jgi:hypothetical protein